MIPPLGDLVASAFYGVIYTVALLAIATWIFSRRNL
jgi:ABC-type transport system involved in multi-copper enzyme maturation permease subunit